MFSCDYKKLRLSFNEFHNIEADNMPEYGSFYLLEMKDGRYTAGTWYPADYKDKKSTAGKFSRGTGDSFDASEVSKWHALYKYDLSNCLEDEEINLINMGVIEEGTYTVRFGDFKSFADGDFPKNEQYCLLILNDGTLAAGRWTELGEKNGQFIYASALASHSMNKVWAWTPLSSDDTFEQEEERERERIREEKLNKNPVADPEKFKYGTDIDVYYEKALEKLKSKYPWATLTQMKKKTHYVIVPRHGKYIFGLDNGTYKGKMVVKEWTDGSTAEEFIDFLVEYTKYTVENSNPEEKFKLGMDVEVYLEKAYDNVKREYRWLDKKTARERWGYAIKQIDGDWEFVREYYDDHDFSVLDCGSAESFIEYVEHDYEEKALRANPVVATYSVPFGHVELHGWYLERYDISKLKTGDYKVNVTAGDRVAGGSREFFITPYCFEAKTYEEFLNRYQDIVPGGSFGITKKDMLGNNELKKFFGY